MELLADPVRLEVGPYRISLPSDATVTATLTMTVAGPSRVCFTRWTVRLGRFQLLVQLNVADLEALKDQIDFVAKSDVVTPRLEVNGIPGVTHGDYGPPRTWIDWWFKGGDTTLCLCLQSADYPMTEPTPEEVELHRAIIGSVSRMSRLH